MNPLLSVVICTHQPRPEFLRRALAGLAAQTLPQDQWEFVLVDNASTTPVATWADVTFHPGARIVVEEKTGLAYARVRGLRETTGEVLVYVDDDNVLDPGYLAGVAEIARDWPMLGAWGGQNEPEWEEQPAEWTRPHWPLLALRQVERDVWSNAAGADTIPYGAGLCVRRHVAETHAHALAHDPLRQLFGRASGGLLGGEDYDLALTSRDLGLGTGLFARLRLTHIIPKERVQEGYFLRIVEALSRSGVLLDFVRGAVPFQKSRSERLLRFYQRLFISKRNRRFDLAMQRGYETAMADIARFRASSPPSSPTPAAAQPA